MENNVINRFPERNKIEYICEDKTQELFDLMFPIGYTFVNQEKIWLRGKWEELGETSDGCKVMRRAS